MTNYLFQMRNLHLSGKFPVSALVPCFLGRYGSWLLSSFGSVKVAQSFEQILGIEYSGTT